MSNVQVSPAQWRLQGRHPIRSTYTDPSEGTMSAPDTNIEKQEKQHKPALLGVKGAIIFGVVITAILGFILIGNGREDHQPAAEEATQGITTDSTVPAVTDAEPNGASQADDTNAAPVDPVAPGTNESN
jgi:hypothetical protein